MSWSEAKGRSQAVLQRGWWGPPLQSCGLFWGLTSEQDDQVKAGSPEERSIDHPLSPEGPFPLTQKYHLEGDQMTDKVTA